MVLKIYFQYDTLLSEKFQCFYNAYKIKLTFLCSSFYIFIHSLFSTCFSKLVFSYFPAHNFYSDFLEVAEWYLLLFHLLYCFFLKYLSSLIQLWESYPIYLYNHLFVAVWLYKYLFYNLDYNPVLLYLFYCLNCCKFGYGYPFLFTWGLF